MQRECNSPFPAVGMTQGCGSTLLRASSAVQHPPLGSRELKMDKIYITKKAREGSHYAAGNLDLLLK